MEKLAIGKKTENGGFSAQGRLSAEEFNAVVGKVNELLENSGDLSAKIGYIERDRGGQDLYLGFSDVDSADLYYTDTVSHADLRLAAFEAPANYSAGIELLTPAWCAVLSSDKDNLIRFNFAIQDKTGTPTGENTLVQYTVRHNGTATVVKSYAQYGSPVSFNVDSYLPASGTVYIEIRITGERTFASTFTTVTYQVVDLVLSEERNITGQAFAPSDLLDVHYHVAGSGTKRIQWILDGERLQEEDEAVQLSVSKTKLLPLRTLAEGRHSLQYRAYVAINGTDYYSNSIYREFVVDSGTLAGTVPCVGAMVPAAGHALAAATLYGLVQYAPYDLYVAQNNREGADRPLTISIDGTQLLEVELESGVPQQVTIRPVVCGEKTLAVTCGGAAYNLSALIGQASITLNEITDSLVLGLSAVGRSNSSSNKDTWEDGGYSTSFRNFAWTDTSGWHNNRLNVRKGSSISIDIAPLSGDVTRTGYTLEFEFSTANSSDDDAVLLDLVEDTAGIIIKSTYAAITDDAGNTVFTRFKSNETYRIAFVIYGTGSTVNNRFAMLYVNHVMCGCMHYNSGTRFTSGSPLVFGSADADISIKDIRLYARPLAEDEIFNNHLLYRDSVTEMLDLHARNDIFSDGAVSIDKLRGQLPVMLVTGDVDILENTSSKDTSIYVDVEYTNAEEPELNFTAHNVRMRPQGTSSMTYPKKNFRLYTNKHGGDGEGWLKDYAGNLIADGKYSFKPGAQPVDVWCFKADYAESSSSHNTGVARLWNTVLKNVTVGQEHVCRTQAQQAAIDNGYPYDVRTTVDGFPMAMFYRKTADSPLVFLGKYNFNNDKSTESVFGFRDIPGFDNSRVQCFEVLNSDNHIALFTDVSHFYDTDAEGAHAWEYAFEARYPDEGSGVDTTALYSFCSWLASTSGNIGKFNAECAAHIDMYKMAAYYIYLMYFGAVDQTVKNAMLTTEDGSHWFFINYDNDSIGGDDNTSRLIVPWNVLRGTRNPDIVEGDPYYYAGHESILWNNVEASDVMQGYIATMAGALYSAGLTCANVLHHLNVLQCGMWCGRLYNKDAEYKYIGPFNDSGIDNLYMAQGDRVSFRNWWFRHRFDMFESMYVSGDYKSSLIRFNCNGAPAVRSVDLVAGADYNYAIGSGDYTVLEHNIALAAGEGHTFTYPAEVSTQVGNYLYLYAAKYIRQLDLRNFGPVLNRLDISAVTDNTIGTRLERLILGMPDSGFTNATLSAISGLPLATALTELDVCGFMGLGALDLSGNKAMETVHAENTGITNIILPQGCAIRQLHYPAAVTSIVLEGCASLDTLDCQGGLFANLNTLRLWDCAAGFNATVLIDTLLANRSTMDGLDIGINRINWSTTYGQLEKLHNATLDLRGKITLAEELTAGQADNLRQWYGADVFSSSAALQIKAPTGLFISGPDAFTEGGSADYAAVAVGAEEPYTLTVGLLDGNALVSSLTAGGVTVSIDGEGHVTATEGLAVDLPLTIRAIYQHLGTVVKDKSVTLRKKIYVTGGSITGDANINTATQRCYELVMTPPDATEPFTSAVRFSDGLGAYLSVDNTSTATHKVLNVDTLPAGMVSGAIYIDITTGGSTFTLEKTVSVAMEGVVITTALNPKAMALLHAAGACANASYMTQEEVEAITDLSFGGIYAGSVFKGQELDADFSAFRHFTGLAEVGSETFSGCSGLTSITIPNSVTGIGNYAFYYCRSLTDITIPLSVTSIGSYACAGCSGLVSITLPASVTNIGNNAFMNSGLASIAIPESVTSLGSNAFFQCLKLADLRLPDAITAIGDKTFSYCRNLASIVMGNALTSIGLEAFYSCDKLSSITILAVQAPTVEYNSFGRNGFFAGGSTRSSGDNTLHLVEGATGYNEGYWLSVLLNASKCGFTIVYDA